jgi:group I intron endonuclease
MYLIYSLKCPLTEHIRYVGQTKQKLEKRFSNHIWESKKNKKSYSHKDNWIRKLLKVGLEPIIEIIEYVESDLNFALEREMFWIKEFKKLGYNLVNATDGGEYSMNNVVIKTSMIGEKNPMFGKKHKSTSKTKMRQKKKGMYIGENNPRSKTIYQYDEQLLLIKEWRYAKECSDFYNISRGNISVAANHNSEIGVSKYMIRYGFIFSFVKLI